MALEVIKEVYKRKRTKREALRQVVLRQVFDALYRLSEEVSFQEAYIFGSLTEPFRFTEFSDVDIAFKGLNRDDLFFVIGFLMDELNREVNVVPIEGLRPCLLSQEAFRILNELRAFRDFFRHAYGYEIEGQRVMALAEKATGLKEVFNQDYRQFIEKVKKAIKD